jgi:hypothetical protein
VPEVEELAESLSETFGLEEVAKNGIPEPYRTVIEKIVFG